jgi:hypothetical protein
MALDSTALAGVEAPSWNFPCFPYLSVGAIKEALIQSKAGDFSKKSRKPLWPARSIRGAFAKQSPACASVADANKSLDCILAGS